MADSRYTRARGSRQERLPPGRLSALTMANRSWTGPSWIFLNFVSTRVSPGSSRPLSPSKPKRATCHIESLTFSTAASTCEVTTLPTANSPATRDSRRDFAPTDVQSTVLLQDFVQHMPFGAARETNSEDGGQRR